MDSKKRAVPVLLIAIPALLAVLAWSLLPAWAGFAATPLAIIGALILGLPGHVGSPRRLAVLAALATLTALAGALEFWPEDCVSCDGAPHYAKLFGVQVGYWAAGGYALLALISGLQAHRERLQAVAELAGWALIGASLWYLYVSLRLDLLCSHCMAVHSVVLCFIAPLLGGGTLPFFTRILTLLIGGLGLHALHHDIQSVAIEPDDTATTQQDIDPDDGEELSTAQLRFLLRADHGRRFGQAQAPLVCELLIGYHCPHCAELFPNLIDTLRPAIADGRLLLIIRQQYSPRILGMRRLPELGMAASASGSFMDFVEAMMPSPADQRPEQIDALVAERLPALDLPGLSGRYRVAIEALLAADRRQLQQLGMVASGVPQLLLRRRGARVTLAHWQRNISLETVRRMIERERGR